MQGLVGDRDVDLDLRADVGPEGLKQLSFTERPNGYGFCEADFIQVEADLPAVAASPKQAAELRVKVCPGPGGRVFFCAHRSRTAPDSGDDAGEGRTTVHGLTQDPPVTARSAPCSPMPLLLACTIARSPPHRLSALELEPGNRDGCTRLSRWS
ncbi:unnamed protein product [Pleuronectes platessa]|uniref:Uncharacterized protein n=1 Tax=Pleuronectes platessa TaxID=8262 RepID=A0A9N7YDS1_PLEPL|nr:unnamed protein product [Pleuronectes platessa]